MRIALFSWESLDSVLIGGVGAHVSLLGRALARKGHEVHLFTRQAGDQPVYEPCDGIFVHRCPYETHADFFEEMWNMCRSFEHHFFTTRALVGEFDVVHAHDWMTAEMLSMIQRQCPAARILTIHSTEYGRCGNNLYGGRCEAVRHSEWRGIYMAERVICVSKALQQEVGWLYHAPVDKCHPIYNGVEIDPFDFEIDAGQVKESIGVHPMAPTILVAGRIVYQKGIDILLDAVPFILKHVPTAVFVFAGDGEMRWDLEASCRTRGFHQNTRWLGKVAPDNLRKYFKMCDALCVPSRNEPFGIVILEAWAAGKPVVVSRNGGPGEIVTNDKTGYVVDATPGSVAWGVGHIFANFEHARWMGKNGRAEVEARFTWDKIADQTLAVYANQPVTVDAPKTVPEKPPAKKEAPAKEAHAAEAASKQREEKTPTPTPRRSTRAPAKKRR